MTELHEGLSQLAKRVDAISDRVDRTLEKLTDILSGVAEIKVRQDATNSELKRLNGTTATNSADIKSLQLFTKEHPLDCEVRTQLAKLEKDFIERQSNRDKISIPRKYAWALLLAVWTAFITAVVFRFFGAARP